MQVAIFLDLKLPRSSQNTLCDISFIRCQKTAKLLNICFGGERVGMAAVPQGAFAARKVRLNAYLAEKWQNSLLEEESPEGGFEYVQRSASKLKVNESTMEQPMKYSSKLMNSIWGLYNRYSVHNLKKITDGKELVVGEHQLPAAVTQSHLERFFVACQNN